MDSIRARRGLCTKLAKVLKVDRRIIWQWHRVPIRHAIKVARTTGIPITIIKGEHARNWPIPLVELARRAGYTIGKRVDEVNATSPGLNNIEGHLPSSFTSELDKLSHPTAITVVNGGGKGYQEVHGLSVGALHPSSR